MSRDAATVDMSTRVGSVELAAPVMTAAGTAGHATELAAYMDLASLGAFVTKSLCAEPWSGNPVPRLHETAAGMLNSIGLQGPGMTEWLSSGLPALTARGARVVVSIWGTTIDDYRRVAEMLAAVPDDVVAVEVNVSCPNHHERGRVFAHSSEATATAIEASLVCGRPVWAKLSPNVTDLVSIARAAHDAGAQAVTLINTLMGMAIDTDTRRPSLGAGGGGLSGPAIHPVAVRAIYDVRAAGPDIPIIGVGGVARGVDAVEMLMAGASAVQVGTATFADPAAPLRVIDEMRQWCADHGIGHIEDLIGVAHGG